jgi:hypothetical protein
VFPGIDVRRSIQNFIAEDRPMRNAERHLTAEELLLFQDGEMDSGSARIVQAHLTRCQDCSTALKRMKATLEHVDTIYRLDEAELHERSGERMRLRMQLKQEAQGGWLHLPPASLQWGILQAAVVIIVFAAGLYAMHEHLSTTESADVPVRSLPNPKLTPGNVMPVGYADICPAKDQDQDPPLPVQVQDTVFREYGVSGATKEREFQVDYLISPQLGGTSEIRNLWPQPYRSTVWNASAKDALEGKLHRMVCQGEMPLSEAQQEIATDWIAAYKRYFRTETPLPSEAMLAGNNDRRNNLVSSN